MSPFKRGAKKSIVNYKHAFKSTFTVFKQTLFLSALGISCFFVFWPSTKIPARATSSLQSLPPENIRTARKQTLIDREFSRILEQKKALESFEVMAIIRNEVFYGLLRSLESIPLRNLKKRREIYFPSVKRDLENLLDELMARARSEGLSSKDLKIDELFWINKTLVFRANKQGLRFLSEQPEIKKLFTSKEAKEPKLQREESLPYGHEEPVVVEGKVLNWGLKKISLSSAVQAHQNLENEILDGRGIKIGVIDSGIDAGHESLKGKVEQFYDVRKKGVAQPQDYSEHGTQVSGVLVGGSDSKGLQTGVAPGSKLLMAGGFKNIKHVFLALQFLLNPDNDFNTQDQPLIMNNSWDFRRRLKGPATGEEAIFRALESVVNAGVLPIFSAGNRGPRKSSLGVPALFPQSLTVSAVDRRGKVPSFSSRGPAQYAGKSLRKPELTAPGKELLTTGPRGGYTRVSGTSIAAPHVSATAALLLQIEPTLTGAQIKSILIESANDGRSSWNPSRGYGLLDPVKATFLAREYSEALMAAEFRNHDLIGPFSGVFDPWNYFTKSPRQIVFMAQLHRLRKGQWLHETKRFFKSKNSMYWIPADQFWEKH
jgi:hypothetical protein